MNILIRISRSIGSRVNGLAKNTNWYKNQLADKSQFPTNQWYRKNHSRQFDIINIGSSNAFFAFNYTETGLKGLNWAGKPQSLELGFKLLKNFYSILKPKGLVCIPLGPFTGLKAPWTGKTEENKYFGILYKALFNDYEKVEKEMGSPFFCHPKTAIKRFIKDEPIIKPKDIKQLKTDDEFKADAERWISNWLQEFEIENLQAPLTDKLLAQIQYKQDLMIKIMDFCTERNLRVAIIIPPIHKELNEQFPDSFYDNYLKPIVSAATSRNAILLDLMKDPYYSKELFFNSLFLNSKGSQKFMQDLKDTLSL